MEYPEQYLRWLCLQRTFNVPPADAASEYTLAWFDEDSLEKDEMLKACVVAVGGAD